MTLSRQFSIHSKLLSNTASESTHRPKTSYMITIPKSGGSSERSNRDGQEFVIFPEMQYFSRSELLICDGMKMPNIIDHPLEFTTCTIVFVSSISFNSGFNYH